MPNVLVNDVYLTNIANSIRAKNGTETTYKPSEMSGAIDAIKANPVLESITITENGTYTPPTGVDGYNPVVVDINIPTGDMPPITGDCQYRFAYNGWNWFMDLYGSTIKTQDITNTYHMFGYSNELQKIPFSINFEKSTNSGHNLTNTFTECYKLLEVPKMNYARPSAIRYLFDRCRSLRYIPDDFDSNWDWSYMDSSGAQMKNVFNYCYSLRKLPMNMIKHGNPDVIYLYSWYYYMCEGCYSLDEIIGLPIPHYNSTWTSNAFRDTFSNCSRLKDMTFALQEDGTPYIVKWKAQTIDFTYYVGYTNNKRNMISYNNGITEDKWVNDDTTYQALKDDPDWFATDIAYSRYNHTSAVNTINSLPDTSAYGTNIIKFKGNSGSATDGGAISNLTEEEIAIATAKGWTISLS